MYENVTRCMMMWHIIIHSVTSSYIVSYAVSHHQEQSRVATDALPASVDALPASVDSAHCIPTSHFLTSVFFVFLQVTTDLISVASAHFIGTSRFLTSAVAGAGGWAGGWAGAFLRSVLHI
jgi:hypothetical protein